MNRYLKNIILIKSKNNKYETRYHIIVYTLWSVNDIVLSNSINVQTVCR